MNETMRAIVPALASAAPTDIVIRARAKDAKFIGSSIGGARVTITEAASGLILAQGMTKGSTGNTTRIMKQPIVRGEQIAEGAAGYQTRVDIDKPVFVTVKVLAPYTKKQARIEAQTQMWLIPGKHLLGDGIVVEIPGMIVDILSPQTHAFVEGEKSIEISANVVMMCGCSFTSGGLWDADKLEVAAIVTDTKGQQRTIPLAFTGKRNTFSARLESPYAGVNQIQVYAYDKKTGNTGLDQTSVIWN